MEHRMSFLKQPTFTTWMRQLLGHRYYVPLREAYIHYQKSSAFWRDDRWVQSVQRLRMYKNRHKGERCFIIGNGPSLKKTDLSLLKDEVTFGLNRIYLLFDELGFATTYYVSVNQLVIEQFAYEIKALFCPKFLSWLGRDQIDFTENMMFLNPDVERFSFSTDITKGIWVGATVTNMAIQIAYYMGFETVILVGVDHSFATQGKPHSIVTSEEDDTNHFDPRYFGKGLRWQLPDLETSELAFRIAKYWFEQSGREILDATIDGKLQVFRKADYYHLF